MIKDIPNSLLAAVIGVISNKKVVTESTGVQFYSDIPNDQWLNDKQRLANSMYNENNKGIIGSVTGSFNKPVKLPVDFLKNIPGHRGEHVFRENPTSEKSKEIEQKASVDGFNTEKHPIYVTVNHRGIPYINEGNHRLGYAIRHGLKTIHANVEYFNGGELSVMGALHPDAIKKYNTENTVNESVEHPMIDVDGAQKHRHNSLGQPIHHTDEGIRNFHRWFGDSKTVDEHGRPLVVYHGTPHYGFDAFDLSKFGERDRGDFGKGVYFSGNKITASSYESPGYFNKPGSGDKTYSVYLKMESPLLHSNRRGAPDWIDREKHDSVWIHSDRYDELPIQHHKNISELVVLHPHQIKSVDNSGSFSHPTKINESEDYREEHTSPDPDSGAPAHNLSSNGVYPDDFYSSKGVQYYGDGRNDDKIVHAHLKSLRNRPEADVKIYRAVPNKDEIKDINPGDWVTTNLEYAKDHGEARFDNHKILTKNVKAKELFTDGNSFHEFGYHPAKQQHTMTDSVRQAYINMTND